MVCILIYLNRGRKMWNANGILIQGLNDKTNFINNFSYQGVNAYFQYPLTYINDSESRGLTNEQQSKMISNNLYQILEFISDSDLYVRYLKKCNEMKIEIRTLFVESEYLDEIWKGELPKMKFLGYEYCPIPIDEQVITDMDWYEPFSIFWNKLNEYGLFNSYEDALEFAKVYDKAVENAEVGDGEIDTYICRISQVILEK